MKCSYQPYQDIEGKLENKKGTDGFVRVHGQL